MIWAAVVILALYAAHGGRKWTPRAGERLIVWGGAIVPTLVLGVLLAYGLRMLPPLLDPGAQGGLRIDVMGEQWWWRIRYPDGGEGTFETANEIRLPVGEPVEFHLSSSNVIHAFWIPSIGGKRDMIPGRVTRLTLTPTRTGTFRGVCAEYCGSSHALMAFDVVVMEKEAFERWRQGQAQPALEPQGEEARRGRTLFIANGCGGCHSIRGAGAKGVVGPDLTHVGSRLSLGAASLPNQPAAMRKWIAQVDHIKPGALMPHFSMLSDEDLRKLTAYLQELK